MLDRSVAELANRIAQHQPGRLLALVAATYLIALPILAVIALAIAAIRRREPHPLSLLVLATVGALAALGSPSSWPPVLPPRPYWALPEVYAIGARGGDSAFLSVHAAVAAALAYGLVLVARRWGLLAAGTALPHPGAWPNAGTPRAEPVPPGRRMRRSGHSRSKHPSLRRRSMQNWRTCVCP